MKFLLGDYARMELTAKEVEIRSHKERAGYIPHFTKWGTEILLTVNTIKLNM